MYYMRQHCFVLIGILVLVGVFVYSRISGLAAFLSASLATFTAVAVGAPAEEIYSGLWGFVLVCCDPLVLFLIFVLLGMMLS